MKVKELIEKLNKMDGDRIVILQKDAEGNYYSPCVDIDDNSVYEAESTWNGTVKYQTMTEELKNSGYTEEDIGAGEKCVVLWPIN